MVGELLFLRSGPKDCKEDISEGGCIVVSASRGDVEIILLRAGSSDFAEQVLV